MPSGVPGDAVLSTVFALDPNMESFGLFGISLFEIAWYASRSTTNISLWRLESPEQGIILRQPQFKDDGSPIEDPEEELTDLTPSLLIPVQGVPGLVIGQIFFGAELIGGAAASIALLRVVQADDPVFPEIRPVDQLGYFLFESEPGGDPVVPPAETPGDPLLDTAPVVYDSFDEYYLNIVVSLPKSLEASFRIWILGLGIQLRSESDFISEAQPLITQDPRFRRMTGDGRIPGLRNAVVRRPTKGLIRHREPTVASRG